MKTNIFRVVLCLAAVVTAFTTTLVTAICENKTVDEATGFIDGIIKHKLAESGVDSVQQWIDGELTEQAGLSSEWYILSLAQSGDYDFSSYENSLLRYLSENQVGSASSRLKYAVVLISVGSTNEYITDTINNSIGEQGIVSWVYGLHILNNGYVAEKHTVESVLERILSLQLPDGGWALTGNNADVDVTAMVVQSLAPHRSNTDVEYAVERAVALLSSRQKDSGIYAGYGTDNPESAAQVIVALSALGIDCRNDERFIKNGNDIFRALAEYKLENGAYCHKLNGAANENATAQVYYSMIAYIRMTQGKTGLYVLDKRNPSGVITPNEPPQNNSTDNSHETSESHPSAENAKDDETDSSNSEWDTSYKIYAVIFIAAFGIVTCITLILVKKGKRKNILSVVILSAAAIAFVALTDFQTADEFYDTDISHSTDTAKVTISIRCDAVSGMAEHIPTDGVILDRYEINIEEGDSVYDVLSKATSVNKIHLETNGVADMLYVEGIANIYELDYGDLSGWAYRVNGAEPSVSCGEYTLEDGDIIEWLYTCELGNDID